MSIGGKRLQIELYVYVGLLPPLLCSAKHMAYHAQNFILTLAFLMYVDSSVSKDTGHTRLQQQSIKYW